MTGERDHLDNIMLRSIVLSSLLIEGFDELEDAGYAKQKFKLLLKKTIKEAEKYVDRSFDLLDDTLPATEYVRLMSAKVEEVFEQKPE